MLEFTIRNLKKELLNTRKNLTQELHDTKKNLNEALSKIDSLESKFAALEGKATRAITK